MSLADRMRKARESLVEIGDFRFRIIRPTVEQMVALKQDGFAYKDLARDYVVGWDNVREADILKGGSTDPAPFDPEVWALWLADQPEWWITIGKEVLAAFNRYSDYKEEQAKN